jgi:hypothetical protein
MKNIKSSPTATYIFYPNNIIFNRTDRIFPAILLHLTNNIKFSVTCFYVADNIKLGAPVLECNIESYFIFVGCILLRYLHMLYKHTTQKPYICDPQTQLTISLLFQNFTTCFGPYGPSSGDIFEDSHSTATHRSFLQVWGYLLLLNLSSYDGLKKIIILERTNFIWILFTIFICILCNPM